MSTKAEAAQKYLDATQTQIKFQFDVPIDVDLYIEKLNKLAAGIEYCWEDLSEESRQFFIDAAHEFICQSERTFNGFNGIYYRFLLLIPSLSFQKNLYRLYKDSFLIIPRAVIRAVDKCNN